MSDSNKSHGVHCWCQLVVNADIINFLLMALTTDAIHFLEVKFPFWGVLFQIKDRDALLPSHKSAMLIFSRRMHDGQA